MIKASGDQGKALVFLFLLQKTYSNHNIIESAINTIQTINIIIHLWCIKNVKIKLDKQDKTTKREKTQKTFTTQKNYAKIKMSD